jgi:basic amino acid/polyamine antiporter, APA family
VPILFTDKTFVLDFTSIATLFAFVLVCGGILLIPRKEKVAGKFNMPYVNGKFIFPVMLIGSIFLASSLSKNYFSDKVDFSNEKRVDALASIIPAKYSDTVAIAQNFENGLMVENKIDSTFKGLQDSLTVRSIASEKINFAKSFISAANTEQSKTMKVSVILFWLLMIGLAILAFIKNYSLIPLLGVASCLYLLTGMTLANWLWFGGWLGLGLIVYFLYGFKKSKLAS